MKKQLKAFVRSPIGMAIIAFILAQIIRFIYKTSRYERKGHHLEVQAHLKKGKPVILAFWHGRIMMMPFVWLRPNPIYVIASEHADGHLIAKTTEHLGINYISGSSRRGGTKALIQALSTLRRGATIAISPDGPKGPRMQINGNILALAQKTNTPIVPAAYSANPVKIAKSWDAFLIPKPFGKGVLMMGKPIHIPQKTSPEENKKLLKTITETMITLQKEADEDVQMPQHQQQEIYKKQ